MTRPYPSEVIQNAVEQQDRRILIDAFDARFRDGFTDLKSLFDSEGDKWMEMYNTIDGLITVLTRRANFIDSLHQSVSSDERRYARQLLAQAYMSPSTIKRYRDAITQLESIQLTLDMLLKEYESCNASIQDIADIRDVVDREDKNK